jgi:hypothetical protein
MDIKNLRHHIENNKLSILYHPYIEASRVISILISLKSMRGLYIGFHHDDVKKVNHILESELDDLFIQTDELTNIEEGAIIVSSKYDEVRGSINELLSKNIKLLILSPHPIDLDLSCFEIEMNLILSFSKFVGVACLKIKSSSDNDYSKIDRKIYSVIQNILNNESQKHVIVYFNEFENIHLIEKISNDLNLNLEITKASDVTIIEHNVIHILNIPSYIQFRNFDSKCINTPEYKFYIYYQNDDNKTVRGTEEVEEYNRLATSVSRKQDLKIIKRVYFEVATSDLVII